MNLPPDIEFHEDIRLFIYRPCCLLDEASVDRAISVLGELEKNQKDPFNRFSDASGTHEVELNFRYVIQVSLHRRQAHAGRAPVKSAILATNSTIVHYARLLVMLTEGSSIKVRLFADRQEAARWLKVPVDLLQAKEAGGTPHGS